MITEQRVCLCFPQQYFLSQEVRRNVKTNLRGGAVLSCVHVRECVRAPGQWRPRPTMQSGKQTWKRQEKTSTQAEQCTRAFPSSSGPFARRIQSHTRRPVVTSTVTAPWASVRAKLSPMGCDCEWLFPLCAVRLLPARFLARASRHGWLLALS